MLSGIVIIGLRYLIVKTAFGEVIQKRLFSPMNLLNEPNVLIRIFQWIWGLQLFRENIWGIGLWNFTKFTREIFAGNSTWVNMLLDLGFLGTIGFFIIFISSVKNIFAIMMKHNENKGLQIGLFVSLICFLLAGVTENLLQSGFYTTFVFWLLIAFSEASVRLSFEQENISQETTN